MIEEIIQEIVDIVQGKDFKSNYSILINNNHNIDFKIFTWPLYYLFDSKINDKIGSNFEIRNNLRSIFNLDFLFGLNKIYDIKIPDHSIILYPFLNNDRYYLYISNAGAGVDNQINLGGSTACIILNIIDIDKVE
jgi:hypothetical protein